MPLECDHWGWMLWATYYSMYCPNCGRATTIPRLMPLLGVHQKGEWVIDYYKVEDLLRDTE